MALQTYVAAFMAEVDKEFQAGTSEKDTSPTGRLAGIFRDAGWSFGVTRTPAGKVNDWCGFFPSACLYRAGMAKELRSAFYHCDNFVAHCTYGRERMVNPRRFKPEVLVGSEWVKVEDWHKSQDKLRSWLGEDVLRAGPVEKMDLQTGDIVEIDWQGGRDREDNERDDSPDHFVIVESFKDGVMVVKNGNASGTNAKGLPVGDAVCRTVYNLNDAAKRKLIFGRGRLSPLDSEPGHQYR